MKHTKDRKIWLSYLILFFCIHLVFFSCKQNIKENKSNIDLVEKPAKDKKIDVFFQDLQSSIKKFDTVSFKKLISFPIKFIEYNSEYEYSYNEFVSSIEVGRYVYPYFEDISLVKSNYTENQKITIFYATSINKKDNTTYMVDFQIRKNKNDFKLIKVVVSNE